MSSTERTLEDGPVALVTGAAGGIGSAVVAAFEAAGHRVLGVDREEADLTDADARDGGWTAR
jgi:NADP-dependent 3-hydroxy acid dehydrogenase YdfG